MATCPSPPAPMTTVVDPPTSRGSTLLIAWYGVSAASVSEAARIGIEVADGNEVTGGVDDHVLRHRTVRSQSWRDHPVQTQVLGAIGAHLAHAATPAAVDDDRLPDLDAAGTLPELLHDAGRLVAQASSASGRGSPPRASSSRTRRSGRVPDAVILSRTSPGPGEGLSISISLGRVPNAVYWMAFIGLLANVGSRATAPSNSTTPESRPARIRPAPHPVRAVPPGPARAVVDAVRGRAVGTAGQYRAGPARCRCGDRGHGPAPGRGGAGVAPSRPRDWHGGARPRPDDRYGGPTF